MGIFLDKVSQRLASSEAIAHRIALYLAAPNRLAMCVESVDDIFFYRSLGKRYSDGKTIEYFATSGRRYVVATLDILRDLGKSQVSFGIVDRDYNFEEGRLICDGRCLVLDVYSYEIYISTPEVMHDLVRSCFSLEVDSEYLSVWNSWAGNFLNTMEELLWPESAISLWCRRNGATCNLNNVNISKGLVSTNDGIISRGDNMTDLFIADANIVDQIDFSVTDPRGQFSEVFSMGWRSFTRGHFYWKIFCILINIFREHLDDEYKTLKKNRTRTRSELTERQILETAVHLMDTPPILEEFFVDVVFA